MEKHYCVRGFECPNVYCSENLDWIHRLDQSEQAQRAEALANGIAFRPGMELRRGPHDISVG